MAYEPRWYPQLDGSTHQGDNCGAASGGMLSDRARKGVKPATSFPWRTKITRQADGTGWITPLPTMSSAIRNWIANHYATSGVWGLYAKWIRPAIKAMYGVSTGYAYGIDWATFASFIVAGKGCFITIHYGAISGTRYDACPGFTGNHWLYVNERRWNATLGRYEYLVYDPLADHRRSTIPQGPQWWPATLLRKAFEASPSREVVYTL